MIITMEGGPVTSPSVALILTKMIRNDDRNNDKSNVNYSTSNEASYL